ncbi:MAG TPA: M56 family metallopeptidase [Steroidobacteraceae bacterium]|nr:M56 family metallopeptidase [Steroidobacteraceae bacterium]
MSALADHLWQSTWFALVAWLLAAALRRDLAKLRSWIWLAASLKFLFPFALLSWLGSQFMVQAEDGTALLPVVQQVATPLNSASIATRHVFPGMQWLLLAIWAPISAIFLQRLILGWIENATLLRTSYPYHVFGPIVVRVSHAISSPCVIGVIEPVVLLPVALAGALSPTQLHAVLAHELEHVRRRDNFVGYVHSFIQALFWFHPLVWLIGARLIREREYACDEAAVAAGYEPSHYAATLLRVCRHSIEPKRVSVAYASGGDLSARIRAIISTPRKSPRTASRRWLVAVALMGCTAVPIASGMNIILTSQLDIDAGARSIRMSKVNQPSVLVMGQNYVYGRSVTLRQLIMGACSVGAADVGGDVRDLDHPRYDVEIKAVEGGTADQKALLADLLQRRFNITLIVRHVPRPLTN